MNHHIANALKFGIPVVVAINKFATDTDKEIKIVAKHALNAGAHAAVLANHWAKGYYTNC